MKAGHNAAPGGSIDDEKVPLFGSWPRIYGAVVISALAVMALVTLFSHFPY